MAEEPILDNTLAIHHMVLKGCSDKVQVTGKPYSCLMGHPQCGSLLGGWTVGAEGWYGKLSLEYLLH